MKNLNIVIDDLRMAPKGWLLFKSGEDFLSWIEKNKEVEINIISFDHDLGKNAIDGYELVGKLVDMDEFINVKQIQFHTSNIPGLINMYSYLISAKKYGEISKDIQIIDRRMDLIDGEFTLSPYTFVNRN